MDDAVQLLLATGATLLAYLAARRLYAIVGSPLATPVFVATVFVMTILWLLHLPYERYLTGASPLVDLLGPATAALAIPLYKHRKTLRAFLLAALGGVICGAAVTMLTAIGLAVLFRLPEVVIASIGFKSVTAPIAAELAPLMRGDQSMAVTFAVATGIFGAMVGPSLLWRLGVSSPLARGLAYGTISTGIGTARAICEGELQGAASATSMSVSGMLVASAAPHVMPLMLHCCKLAFGQ
jgi:putative effector of murein hydrolase